MGDQIADIVPVFIPEKSLIRYGMKLSEDIGHSVPMHSFQTQQIKEELTAMGFMCDFHAVREKVFEWTLETILVVKDEQGLYGENYFWAASQALMNQYNPQEASGSTSNEPQESESEKVARLAREEEEKAAETKLLTYVEPDWVPKHWVSLGSEAEIDSFWIEGSCLRAPTSFQFLKPRKLFGGKYQFDNVDVKDSQLISCNRQIDKNYDQRKMCLEGGFQSAAPRVDAAVQTSSFRRVNKMTAYNPMDAVDNRKNDASESADLARALKASHAVLQIAIEQNITVDIFRNDLDVSGEHDLPLGPKSEHIRFFNTFVDLLYSKSRRITAIDWDSSRPGAVSVSCARFRTSDERIDALGTPQPSSVLIWNFNDLIHPEMILEAPDEVFMFRSNPKAPHIVIGGMANGQLIMWNTNTRRIVSKGSEHQRESDLDSNDHAYAPPIIHVDPAMISYTERSHSRPVQCLQWLQPGVEVHKRGEVSNSCTEPHSVQFASLAGDDHLLFWDIRGDINSQDQHNIADENDFRWIPVYSVDLNSFAATSMHLSNDARRSAIFANENGMIALGSWLPKKDPSSEDTIPGSESTANNNSVIGATIEAHTLPCQSLQISPDFPDLVLTVGDWSFCIFRIVDKTKQLQKIFHSGCASDYLTGAVWCPSRPGVIITSKANGSLDVWDLCDQSHKPATSDMMVSSTAISDMQFRPLRYPLSSQSQPIVPYLAIGDCGGNLHIVQLPSNLTTSIPNELQIMKAFYERETRRFQYFEIVHKQGLSESDKKGPGSSHKSEGGPASMDT